MSAESPEAVAYRGIRSRVRTVVGAATPEQLDAVCVLTPEWRVRDVLAHLVGVPNDVLAGRLEGVASDAWTEAQVASRRAWSVRDLLAAWDRDAETMEPQLAQFPRVAVGQMIFDAVTHEHDVRHSLGVPGAHDTDAIDIAFTWLVKVAGPGRPDALRLVTDAGEFVVGPGEPLATVALSRFEYVRAVSGRRSEAQMVGYDWQSGAPRSLIAAPIFSPAPADVVE